jgi:hypothetical protein
MRHGRSFALLVVVASLGGCASAPMTGMCARAPDSDFRREFSPPRTKSLRRLTASYHPLSQKVAVVPAAPIDVTPEPRFTSKEWWMRENARLGKAIIICRGCLPPPTTTSASLPKPAIISNSEIPNDSMNRFEGSMPAGTHDQP